jgi:integrase
VAGKGGRERRVPVDAQIAGWVQTYLLAERPDTDATTLFVVAKGRNRGRPLTPAGLRTIFRYHRDRAGVAAAHPHALRHSFGTALAEAGLDLAGDPDPARACPRRLLGRLHPPRAGARPRRLRCRSGPPTWTAAPCPG